MKFFFTIILACSSSFLFSQSILREYTQAVVYLLQREGNQNKPAGTGFLVSIPAVRNAGDTIGHFSYLVTAKHVIQNQSRELQPSIIVRINLQKGGTEDVEVPLTISGKNRSLYLHPDKSVDLAVIALVTSDAVSYKTLPINFLFPSKESFNSSYVNVGTTLFYTGMFSPYLGYKRNYPIVRFGRVCMITDEKILFDSTSKEASELILAETMTYGGNSGSPIYSYPDNDFKVPNKLFLGNDSIKLVGVVTGNFGETTSISYKPMSLVTPMYTSNVGITAIIPSYLLYEIIISKEAVSSREEVLKAFNKK